MEIPSIPSWFREDRKPKIMFSNLWYSGYRLKAPFMAQDHSMKSSDYIFAAIVAVEGMSLMCFP